MPHFLGKRTKNVFFSSREKYEIQIGNNSVYINEIYKKLNAFVALRVVWKDVFRRMK